MTLGQWIEYGKNALMEAGIAEYESDTKILAQYAFNLNYTELFLRQKDEMPEKMGELFEKWIELRKNHMPCQYITKKQMFMGYEFGTARDVLIPRPETELLVEEALKQAEDFSENPLRVLDLCCGSGCIGLSFWKKREEAGHGEDEVILADISDAALALSERNRCQIDAKCEIVKSDLFSDINGKFDFILSNPPYIKSGDIAGLMEEVRDFEPRLALDGKESGLYFYEKIIKEAGNYLNEAGRIFFEIGFDQYEDVRRFLVAAGFENVNIVQDYAGLDRVVTARYRG